MYANGEVVPQDYQEALKWYQLAAEKGNAYAQSDLGDMYYNGEGVPQDYEEALKWYRLAAEKPWGDVLLRGVAQTPMPRVTLGICTTTAKVLHRTTKKH